MTDPDKGSICQECKCGKKREGLKIVPNANGEASLAEWLGVCYEANSHTCQLYAV